MAKKGENAQIKSCRKAAGKDQDKLSECVGSIRENPVNGDSNRIGSMITVAGQEPIAIVDVFAIDEMEISHYFRAVFKRNRQNWSYLNIYDDIASEPSDGCKLLDVTGTLFPEYVCPLEGGKSNSFRTVHVLVP